MTERELLDRKVRLLRPIETRGGRIFGVGTEMIITGKFAGLQLQQITTCEACGCGNRYTLKRVDFSYCELLPVATEQRA